MTISDLALYLNHRRFLEAQRGALTHHDGYDVVHGDRRDFQISMLHNAGALDAAARAAPSLFSPPWAAIDPSAPQIAKRAYQLTHMSLPSGALAAPKPRPELVIEASRDETALRAFTHVQTAGFVDDAAYPAVFAWLLSKNEPAYRQPDQHFHVLRLDGEPASVLLTVDSGDALGIYAVATLPALRKRGLSSHLLAHVCAAAPASKQICLQVMRGSDAERLYGKIGFRERFLVDVYESAVFVE